MQQLSSIINENIRTAKSISGKVPGATGEPGTPGEPIDYANMFSVKITKSQHISLSELQGHFSPTEAKPRGNG